MIKSLHSQLSNYSQIEKKNKTKNKKQKQKNKNKNKKTKQKQNQKLKLVYSLNSQEPCISTD